MSTAITEASLVEIGDAIRDQLHNYAAEVAANLSGAVRAVLRLREALMRNNTEVTHGGNGRMC